MNPAQRHATYEDLLKVPDTRVAEILDGELFTSPRPASPHAQATSVLRGALDPFDRRLGDPDGPGGWWLLFESELHFGADIIVPDLAGWRRERMPVLRNVAYFELAPDWVCEVVSPSTARVDRVRKVPTYARAGVGQLWLVDPLQQTLEVFRLEGPRWMLVSTHGGSDTIHAEPFEALALDMSRWWLEPEAEQT
ncbi:MAG: Uma2 family endonuclease [Deltaproteobacteria bacterium]|nr:Uma2 family endonuclease [Deltaproteobacteria bacterium]